MGTLAFAYTSERSGQGNTTPSVPLFLIQMSFEERFEEVRHELTNYARRLTQSKEAAEDLVQDVALKLVKVQGRILPRTFRQYALRTVKRTFLDDLRAKNRRPIEWFASQDARINHLLHAVVAEQGNPLPPEFYDALGGIKLPREMTETLELQLQGLEASEISVLLGVKASTVRTRLHRARQIIRAALE